MPGLRRAGRVEPGEAEARVPVLRHRVAVPGQSRHRADRGDRSGQDAARAAGRAARLARREAQRAVPELPRGDGVRPDARRPELRVLRLTGAGGVRRDQGSDQPAEPAAVPRARHDRARADSPLVREQVVRAGQAEVARARRHRARRLPAVLDVRRAGELPVARRGGPLLLHDRDLSRRPGPHRRHARCSTSAGSRRQGRSITSSTTSPCRDRRA